MKRLGTGPSLGKESRKWAAAPSYPNPLSQLLKALPSMGLEMEAVKTRALE